MNYIRVMCWLVVLAMAMEIAAMAWLIGVLFVWVMQVLHP